MNFLKIDESLSSREGDANPLPRAIPSTNPHTLSIPVMSTLRGQVPVLPTVVPQP